MVSVGALWVEKVAIIVHVLFGGHWNDETEESDDCGYCGGDYCAAAGSRECGADGGDGLDAKLKHWLAVVVAV